mmetsp:Transcript_73330/g.161948  ORF Transcript_73330/g.161948 Transcript_73330/m.161948 type:complete len:201 (-) Transcript_73330:89-691(-)
MNSSLGLDCVDVGIPSVTTESMMRRSSFTAFRSRPVSCRMRYAKGVGPRGPFFFSNSARRATCALGSPAAGSMVTKSRPSREGSVMPLGEFSRTNSERTPRQAFHSACSKAMVEISSQRLAGICSVRPTRSWRSTCPSASQVDPELSNRNTRKAICDASSASKCAMVHEAPMPSMAFTTLPGWDPEKRGSTSGSMDVNPG